MSDADLELKFGADTSGVTAGAAETKGAVESIGAPVQGLQEQMLALTEAVKVMTSAMSQMGAEAKKVEGELEEEESVLAGIASSVREFGAAAAETKEAIIGFGEAWMAFFAVEGIVDWVKETAEAGEHAEQLGQKLGTSATDIEQWQGVATLTGRSVDQFASAFTRMTDGLVKGAGGSKMQAEAMKDLGLTAADASNPMEAVAKAADRFKEMGEAGESARAIADAMALMGRSGADMLPILEQGSAALNDLKQKSMDYGSALTGGQNRAVDEAAEAINDFKLRMQGLSEQTFVQLIPLIEGAARAFGGMATAVAQAVQPTSMLRTDIDNMLPAIVGLGAAITAALTLGPVIESVIALGEAIAVQTALATADGMSMLGLEGVIGVLSIAFDTATAAVLEFTVALLANPLTWAAVAVAALAAGIVYLTSKTHEQKVAQDDLHTATQQIDSDMDDLTGKTKEQINKMEEQEWHLKEVATMHLLAAQATLAHAEAEVEGAHKVELFGVTVAQQIPIIGGLITATGAMWEAIAGGKDVAAAQDAVKTTQKTIDDLMISIRTLHDAPGVATPKLGALGQGKGPKPDKDRVQEWEQQFQDIEAASGDFFGDETAKELAYWQNILATQNLTKIEILAIKRQMFGEEKTLAEQARSEALVKIEGETRDQIQAENAKTKAAIDGIQTRMAAVRAAGQRGDIDPGDEKAQLEALNDQEVALEQAKAEAIYQINLNAAHQREALYATDPVNLAKVQATEQGLAKQHQDQLTDIFAQGTKNRQKIDDDAAKQVAANWDRAVSPMVHSFTSGFVQMAEGTKTFQSIMLQIGNGILNDFITKVIDPMVTRWVVGEITKTGISSSESALRKGIQMVESLFGIAAAKTEAGAAVGANAAAAGAAAVASAAAIPLIGWTIAPAAGAEASAAALSFGGLIAASAAGGYDIPGGVNPIVQTHAEEMILPATIANPMRGMLADYAANQNNPAAANSNGDGGIHHHWNINAVDAQSVKNLIMDHGPTLVKSINRQTRAGAKIGGQ